MRYMDIRLDEFTVLEFSEAYGDARVPADWALANLQEAMCQPLAEGETK